MPPDGEEEKIPKRYWYEFFDRFTRRDELLVEILKDIRELLKAIKGLPTPVPPVPEPLAVISLTEETIKKIREGLVQLPNRVREVEIDTSSTDWVSFRKTDEMKTDVALGFHIEEVGGGFTYKIVRGTNTSEEKLAMKNDRFDHEFDDLQVKGSGTTGTAKVWVYWRA